MRGQHVVVAGLQTDEVAAGAFEAVECVEEIERPAQGWKWSAGLGPRPFGVAGGIAAMGADVETGPVIVRRIDWRLERHLHWGIGGHRRSAETEYDQCHAYERISFHFNAPFTTTTSVCDAGMNPQSARFSRFAVWHFRHAISA